MQQSGGAMKWSVTFFTAAVLLSALCSSRIALCRETRVSSATLFARLVSYDNPAGILISGTKCDSGSSACDPSFALTVSLEGRNVIYASSKCSLSNTNQVDFASANLSEFTGPIKSEVGAKPTWAMVNVVVKDCLFDDLDETIAEFQLNFTNNQSGREGVLSTTALLATSEDAAQIVAMQPIRLTPESIKLRISVWTQCSPDFYGQNCDLYCQPNDTCCCNKDGKLLCNQLSSVECITRGGKATTPLPTTTGIPKTRNAIDEASRSSLIMLIAVVTSSIASILVLAGTATLAVKMCKTSESNAIFIRQLQAATPASGTSASASLDPLPLCRHSRQQSQVTLQPSGFLNPASYNTLTSSVTATLHATDRPSIVSNAGGGGQVAMPPQPRPDSGVYDEPMELQGSAIVEMSVSSAGVPPLPARPLLLSQQQQQQQREDVQRMPQSKSYSRRPLNTSNAQ